MLSPQDCQPLSVRLSSYRIEQAQSLSNEHDVFVWLLYLSPTYESKLSTLSLNKKAHQLR